MLTTGQLRIAALIGVREDIYYNMFDSMDSDIVLELIRNVHATQSSNSVRQLIAQLDKMLDIQLTKELP